MEDLNKLLNAGYVLVPYEEFVELCNAKAERDLILAVRESKPTYLVDDVVDAIIAIRKQKQTVEEGDNDA